MLRRFERGPGEKSNPKILIWCYFIYLSFFTKDSLFDSVELPSLRNTYKGLAELTVISNLIQRKALQIGIELGILLQCPNRSATDPPIHWLRNIILGVSTRFWISFYRFSKIAKENVGKYLTFQNLQILKLSEILFCPLLCLFLFLSIFNIIYNVH